MLKKQKNNMGLFSKQIIVATHDGKFHADDIFACATLELFLNTKSRIVRTRDEAVINKADFVVDVGGIYSPEQKRFDHHMREGAGERANGIPYASFGLVWKEYGAAISGTPEIAARIDARLVSPIDADDNAYPLLELKGDVAPFTLQGFMYMSRPTWCESEEKYDEAFLDLVALAKKIILRQIKIEQDFLSAESIVEKAYADASDKRLIILDENCPWQETLLKYPEPLFLVSPRRGTAGWGINAIPVGKFTFENKKMLPESWAGLRDEDLAKITGVADAVFCHRARFLAVAKTKEGALALAKIAISNNS